MHYVVLALRSKDLHKGDKMRDFFYLLGVAICVILVLRLIGLV